METPGRGIEMQKSVLIGGETYKIHMFSPTRAIPILVKLTKLVGEPFSVMATKEKDKDKILEKLPVAVKALMTRIDEDEVLELIQSLLGCVTKNKKSFEMDLEFQGRLGDLMRLTSKIIEVQFEDFFHALGEMFQGEKEAMAE